MIGEDSSHDDHNVCLLSFLILASSTKKDNDDKGEKRWWYQKENNPTRKRERIPLPFFFMYAFFVRKRGHGKKDGTSIFEGWYV